MATAADLELYYASKYLVADGGALTEQTADAGGSTTTVVDAALTEADDYWNGALLRWEDDTTTAALQGTTHHVTDFDAATDTLTVAEEMPGTPVAGDTYRLILGGHYRAALDVYGLTASAPSNVTGVTISYAGYLNETGNGSLAYTSADDSLTWTAPSGTIGPKVDVSGAGAGTYYDLFDDDNDKWITVYVVFASLPVGDESDTIALTRPEGVFVPNMEGAETTDGKIRHHLLVAKNTHGADTLLAVKAYVEKSDPTAAATTINQGGGKDQSAGTLICTSLTNWPTSGWILNTTKTDCCYFYNRSGDTITLVARNDVCALAFDAGDNEISPGDDVEGKDSGATGTVMAVQVDSGTWGGSDAAGKLWLFGHTGLFQDGEKIKVGATESADADGAEVAGFRDLTAVNWDDADAVELMPEFDIGLDAPAAGVYENPAAESIAPAGVTFTHPRTADTGLSIGDLAAAAHYGVWHRETVPVGTYPRADIVSRTRFRFSI